ncbi:hypothetical protein DS2_17988 [Catenovulum agarivorans DS-2]|uniref:Uncharacterized protein n=1 Tax=Catenovulum agarivorans DS-2 TaxID=1328313 RepID=W7QJI2_9ALTE|nr:hypothetical protein [Catenovulum agarivorans]EWH08313.1 hypothetical protein DS2_17988 [Catenovulum agarivorans DS-2]
MCKSSARLANKLQRQLELGILDESKVKAAKVFVEFSKQWQRLQLILECYPVLGEFSVHKLCVRPVERTFSEILVGVLGDDELIHVLRNCLKLIELLKSITDQTRIPHFCAFTAEYYASRQVSEKSVGYVVLTKELGEKIDTEFEQLLNTLCNPCLFS